MPRSAVARNSFKTLGGQWVRYALQIIALILFSRLLQPSDYGILAMATAITSVAFLIGDFGLSLAAIQAEEVSVDQRSALFWTNCALGAGVSVLVLVSAPAVSYFYGNAAVGPVVALLSSTFLLNGLAVQYRVELTREGRFGWLAAIDVLAQAVGMLTGLFCILAGLAYWSLVWMQVVIALVPLILVVATAHWRPGWPRRTGGMKSFLSFGSFTFGTQVVNYLTSNLDSILLGRYGSATSLGLYNRAFQFAFTPIQQVASPLTRVFLPGLATAARSGQNFATRIARIQTVLSYSLGSLLSFLCVGAPFAIPIVLGKSWVETVPMLQVLAVAALFQVFGYPFYWALLAMGRTRALFMAELYPRILMLAALLFAAQVGPIPVAMVVAGGQFAILISLVVVTLWSVRQPVLFFALLRPSVLLTAATAGGLCATLFVQSSLSWQYPFIAVLLWLVVVALALTIPSVRRDILTLLLVARKPA